MTHDNAALDAQILENDEQAEIARLAALNPLHYDRQRSAAGEHLKVTVGALDRAVKEARRESAGNERDGRLAHWTVEPWAEKVGTAELLDAILAMFRLHTVLPNHAGEALALWTLHAWAFDAWDISPFLMLTSPTKRCGKTTVLILLSWLTPRSVIAGNISPSAIFRYIEEQRPTLLVDEADTFLKTSEEMRGILNAGHTRPTAQTIRNVEIQGEIKPKLFSTWSPKIIAGIGRFAGTLEDRSIVVPMQRKAKGAKVERCSYRDSADLIELRQKALRWANDNLPTLRVAKLKSLEALNDRAVNNWEPLLAIAELAGKAWVEKGKAAALALSGADEDSDEIGVDFLGDARKAFAAIKDEDIFSRELKAHLVKDPERPWATYGRGDKEITDRNIGNLLKPFKIISTTIHRADGTQAKGYRFAGFKESWERYCITIDTLSPVESTSHPYKRTSVDLTGTSGTFGIRTETNLYGNEKCELSANDAGLYACTDKKATHEGERSNGHDEDLPIPTFLDRRRELNGHDHPKPSAADDVETIDL